MDHKLLKYNLKTTFFNYKIELLIIDNYILIIMSEKEIENIQKYIAQMTEREKKAYNIAKDLLQSSFNIQKSIGYQNWLKNNSN